MKTIKYIVLALALCALYIIHNDTIYAQAPKLLTVVEICPQGSPTEIICKIRQAFPEEPEIMIAIAMAESGLNNKAVGYNCYYDGESKACEKQDRHKAWSKDFGLYQLNGTKPMTIDQNIKEARKLYDKRGKQPWNVWNTGAYKKYL